MAKLTSKQRNKISSSTFGLPAERKYPMPNESHAANAKARATQQEKAGNITPAQHVKIEQKANKILHKGSGKKFDKVKSNRGTFHFKNNKPGE